MISYRESAAPPDPYRHGYWMDLKRGLQRLRRFLGAKVVRPKCITCGTPSHKVRRNKDMFSPWYYCGCVERNCTCGKASDARCPVHQCTCSNPVVQRCPIHRTLVIT